MQIFLFQLFPPNLVEITDSNALERDLSLTYISGSSNDPDKKSGHTGGHVHSDVQQHLFIFNDLHQYNNNMELVDNKRHSQIGTNDVI